ncbi:MAG: signal peptidase I [Candidatus Azotimanducaceae bacterium]
MIKNIWTEWRGLIIFLVIMILFRSAVADWNQVPTGSMKPTILEGDRVIVNKLAYDLRIPLTSVRVADWSQPKRGEIVTFYSPEDETLLIKRVVGVPGDTVQLANNALRINDTIAQYARLDDTFVEQMTAYERHRHRFFFEVTPSSRFPVMLRPTTPNAYNSFGPVVVPAEHYLMLGDNRDNSRDSRFIGMIHASRITGRAHTVAFSVNYENYYLPRSQRFLQALDDSK